MVGFVRVASFVRVTPVVYDPVVGGDVPVSLHLLEAGWVGPGKLLPRHECCVLAVLHQHTVGLAELLQRELWDLNLAIFKIDRALSPMEPVTFYLAPRCHPISHTS